MSAEASQRYSGHCKWFNTSKGFGFVLTPEGNEIFVHQTQIKSSGFRSLAEGEPVEFEIVTDERGAKAVNVTGPNGADVQGAPFRPPVQRQDNGYAPRGGRGGRGRGRGGYNNFGGHQGFAPQGYAQQGGYYDYQQQQQQYQPPMSFESWADARNAQH